MASGVKVDIEILKSRLEKLLRVCADLDTVRDKVAGVRERQTTDRWSTAADAEIFTRRYRVGMDTLDGILLRHRDRLLGYRDALKASADSLTEVDQRTADLLTQINASLDDTAPSSTPTAQGATPSPSPSPSATGTFA